MANDYVYPDLESHRILALNHEINVGSTSSISDFPSLKEAYGGTKSFINPRTETGREVGLIDAVSSKHNNSEDSVIAGKVLVKNPSSVDIGSGKNNSNWRELFPTPRLALPAKPMKFTPSLEVNGKILVAAQTENFSEGLKKCENLVIGFFVGKRASFAAVQAAVEKLWKFKKKVIIKLYSDCAFVFEFMDECDRRLVLDTGSIYISSRLLTLRPWSQLMEKNISEVKTVPIWIMIYGVPLHMWNNDGLGLISSLLGNPLFADDCTTNQSRLAYARVCVEIVVDFSYPSSIPLLIDDKIHMELPVEYQWKVHKCDICKVFGHTDRNCIKKKKTRWTPKKVCRPCLEKEGNPSPGRFVSAENSQGLPMAGEGKNPTGEVVEESNKKMQKIVVEVTSGEEPKAPTQGSVDSWLGENPLTLEGSSTAGYLSRDEEVMARNILSALNSISKEKVNRNGTEAVKEKCNISSAALKNNKFLVLSELADSGGMGCSDAQIRMGVTSYPVSTSGVLEQQNPSKKINSIEKAQISPGSEAGVVIGVQKSLKNRFIMISDFPFKTKDRFPIDRRVQVDNGEGDREEFEDKNFERNLEFLSQEEKVLKRVERDKRKKEKELYSLQWDGKPPNSNNKENLGRGCRSLAKS